MKRNTNTITIRFPKGVRAVHIPFVADIGTFTQLHAQMEKIKYPKSARRIEATITCSMDLKGTGDYELAEVTVYK